MVQRFTADRAVTWKDRDIDGQHALDDGGDWPGEARPVAQGRELPKAVLRDPPIAGERVLDNVGDQIDDLAGSHQLTQFYGHDRYAATQPPMFLDIACNNYRAPAY
jgi:hypothetical protein